MNVYGVLLAPSVSVNGIGFIVKVESLLYSICNTPVWYSFLFKADCVFENSAYELPIKIINTVKILILSIIMVFFFIV